MRLQLLSFISVAIFVSFVSATGCKKCLNQNEDDIRLGCFNKCKEAFNPSSSEYRICRSQCTDFVFEKHCCTSSCDSKPKVCLNDFFHRRMGLTKRDSADEEAYYQSQLDAIRENPDLLDKRAMLVGDAPYHLIRSTEDLRSLNHPDFHETVVYDLNEYSSPRDLHRRFDRGQTCCWAAQAVLQRGITEVGTAWLSEDNWTEKQRQGLVLVGFGVAGAYACNYVYDVTCLAFNAAPAAPN